MSFVSGQHTTLAVSSAVDVLATPPPEKDLSSLPPDAPGWTLRDDQTNVKFEHISLEHGLSQSSVLCILQDSRGFMWFGTEDGLNRYDGYEFKVYKHDPENFYSLSHSYISHIYEDQVGMLWVVTGDGALNRYDPTTDRFYRYVPDPQNPYSWRGESIWETMMGELAIHSDDSGSVWFGTYGGGLAKYDAVNRHFTYYHHHPDDPLSLSHEKVYAVYEDRQGTLWVGTAAGLQRYVPRVDGFVRYPYRDPKDPLAPDDAYHLSSPYAKIIHEDQSGHLWIATLGGLNKLDRETDQFTVYKHDPEDPNTLSGDLIRVLYEDHTGKFWLSYWGGGLDHFDPQTGEVTAYQHDPMVTQSLSDDHVLAVHEDSTGKIWLVMAAGGVDIFDPETGGFTHYRADPDNLYSLSDNAIISFYEDSHGMLWLGTVGGGVNVHDRAWAKFPSYKINAYTEDIAGNNLVFGVSAAQGETVSSTSNRSMWIGTRVGLNYWNRETGEFTLYQNSLDDPQSLSPGIVWSVLEDRLGNLWVGTQSGLDRATFYKNVTLGEAPLRFTHVLTSAVMDMHLSRSGELWLALHGRGLGRFDRVTEELIVYAHDPDRNSLIDNRTVVILESHQGDLWIGTEAGLDRFDPETEIFTHYSYVPGKAQSLGNNEVRALYEDEAGMLWIGTNGGGLDRLNPRIGTFTHYREGDGLPNGVVYAIVPDAVGNLWIPTNNGLVKFDPQTQTYKTYTRGDGLPSNEFGMGAHYRFPDGEMFFGGVNGFTLFYPEQIQDNPHIPAVVLTSLTQGGEPIPLKNAVEHARSVTLHWPHNFFEFEFAALSYSHPEKNQYAYMLENLDKDWNYVGVQRFGRYTNLPGGTYTLHVKGSNNDGIWSDEAVTLKITVVPPFWGTLWFKVVGVLGLGLLILIGYRWRVRNIATRNRELEMLVAQRTAELRREADQRMRIEEELRQREMEEAVAAERSRLARELHDAVTQTLFSASIIAEAIPTLWEMDAEEGRRRLSELRQLNRGALAEMRTLLLELRPSALVETGLDELLRQLGDAVAGRTGATVNVNAHVHGKIPQDMHIALYRIAQEALNNIVKHARAHEIAMSLYCAEAGNGACSPALELHICDDGCGFEAQTVTAEHLGLSIMEERAQAVDATLRIESQPGCGTQITVIWDPSGHFDVQAEGKGALYEYVEPHSSYAC